MLTTLPRMGKKKPNAKDSTEESRKKTETVRIYEDLVRMAAVISAADKVSVAELLDPVLRPLLTTRYREMLDRLRKDLPDA